jgi:iron complex outermembrane receptor protein
MMKNFVKALTSWRRPIAWVLAVVLGAATVAAAQQGTTLSGTLTNSLSREPVANATVRVEELRRDVRSGADGRFSMTDVPPGTYHILVRASGYTPHRSEITVAAAPFNVDLGIDPELHYTEVLSVSPDARNQFESYQPTTVLAGQDLAKELQGTLGETLAVEPGLATRSFGPGPSRPVIRGLDGDRVLVLEDGQRMGDLSSQSGDHGVNVNPASASRMEVVRGPATLLYGANAIGGLVNVITSSIPTAPVTRASGAATFDLGSSANEVGGAGDVTVGNGKFALHAGASGRHADDYSTPDGDVPNSFNRTGAGEVGLAWTAQNGYLGGSIAYDKSHYGIPLVEAGNTNLDPRRTSFNLRGERTNMGGAFTGLRFSLGVRRYRHDELEGDEVATAFKNDTAEVEVLASHKAAGKLKGSVGAWIHNRNFDVAGEEVLSPAVDQRNYAAFVYEELPFNPHVTLQFGGRIDHAGFEPAEDEPNRSFNNFSGSVGLLLHPSDATTVAFSLARAARNPALEELYYHGPHPGNNAVENGDPDLDSENAIGFDVSFRARGHRGSGEITYFYNKINNFIFREPTDEVEDDLPVTFFRAGDSTLQGIESHVDFVVSQWIGLEGGLDYVRGELTSSDLPLPRMPPLRGRAGVRLQHNAFQAGFDAVFIAKQDRVFTLETPTDGANLLKLFASYSFGNAKATNTITARLDNATNEVYHNHLNYLKDLVPEVGRNFRLLYGVKF